jgi:hypothetical protein
MNPLRAFILPFDSLFFFRTKGRQNFPRTKSATLEQLTISKQNAKSECRNKPASYVTFTGKGKFSSPMESRRFHGNGVIRFLKKSFKV